VEQNVPGAADYAEYVKVGSALSKWYEGWTRLAGEDGRLRCVFHQTKNEDGRGTISGRLSVERIQLQAIPHDYQFVDGVRPVRDLFTAPKDKQLWELDLSQAEFRVAAAIAKEERMLAEFAAGYDAHDATCRLVFEIEQDSPEWEKYRAVSKRLGFGILYGAGARTIQAEIAKWTGLQVTVDQVDRWLKLYGQRMPKMLAMGHRSENLARRRSWVRLAGNRQRWFAPGEETRKAWNQVVQGSVAELMKDAMIKIEAGWPGVMVLQIHDSVWVEVDNETQADCIGSILSQTFEDYYRGVVAFPTGKKRLDHE
jgi:DNA polymerase-1